MRTRSPCSLHRVLVAVLVAMGAPAAARAQLSIENAIHERAAQAGETYSGTIRVRNSSAEPQEAKLYLTDYEFHADGRSLFTAAGSSARSNARWIRIAERVTVPPRGEALVPYTVSVPRDSIHARPGTWWSTVMVEEIAPGSAESSRRSAARARVDMGVRTTTRYAVQLVTHLAGGERRAEFTRVHLERTARGNVLELDVVNTGSAAYRLAFTLELYDMQGAQVGKLEERRGLVYPGSSIRQRFALPALPAGEYKALLVADTGAEDVFGAQYRLTL